MNKRLVSVFLCLLLLLVSVLPVCAEDTEPAEVQEETAARKIRISTAEEFLEFAENCRLDTYSQNLEVQLRTDLDFFGAEFESIPIFSGTFDGGGHSISGLCLKTEGSVQGLFRYLTSSAVVKNLHVSGEWNPGGSRSAIGGIAGQNEGTIRSCSFDGTVSGSDCIGGIAGTSAVTGVIEDCAVSGTLNGDHFVGGIAGENHGVIRRCTNEAEINITAQENSVELSEITLDSLTDSESADTVTDVGGIAGISSGVIRSCKNRADIGYRQMGYNIGGIAGTQSGYIENCENYGAILGRKEVGGIVGQMEPVAQIEYSEDTLQILKGQLGTMSGLVNRASSNAQTNANQISGQIGQLRDQADTAQKAVDTLFPDAENPEIPDSDTILAAQNDLTSSISAMPKTLENIMRATQTTVSTLSNDLQAVAGQVNAMGATINGASENLGGSITDVSDQDTEETLTGKVDHCENYGAVLGDLNIGGVAGMMAVENDLDILEDWEVIGESSLNFESELRAVILNCENAAEISAKKQHAGGIVGWQCMGLVKNSTSTGALCGEDAEYVGGIAGRSAGYIRACSAECGIRGDSYVGGIAGSAAIVTDCRSMTEIEGTGEKIGEVLGGIEPTETDAENPIAGNFFLSVSGNLGAIDGISYSGLAEPLKRKDFFALENLPEMFSEVTVRFVFEDGMEEVLSVASGGSLDASKIPVVPEKAGYTGKWDGLSEADLSNIVFNMTFEPLYTSLSTVIESEAVREQDLPLLLIQGTFAPDAAVQLLPCEDGPTLEEKETLLEAWSISVSGAQEVTAGRLRIPADVDAEGVRVYLRAQTDAWSEAGYTVEGSYLVFDLQQETTAVALVRTEQGMPMRIIAAIAAAAVILLLIALIVRRSGRRKKQG